MPAQWLASPGRYRASEGNLQISTKVPHNKQTLNPHRILTVAIFHKMYMNLTVTINSP